MSTATANYVSIPLPDAVRGRGGSSPQRAAHLHLVPGRQEVAETAPVRLTRRGRLAVTSTVALFLALVGLSLLSALGPASASSSVVVEPGATLSHIAAEHLPTVPLSQAITDIQRANSLSTTSIAAGQELVIPER